jgi:hypothetical protein
LEVLVAGLELADFVDAVVVDALSEVARHLHSFPYQEVLHQLVDLAERQLEDVFARQRRQQVVSRRVLRQLPAIENCESQHVVPAEMRSEED